MTSTMREIPPGVRPGIRALTLTALALATIAAFAGVLRSDWILFDDPVYVMNNVHISRGITAEGLRWIFQNAHGGNFHPLTSISHMVDAEVFGLDPRGHHAVNLALHVVDTLLLCVVLWRYTGRWWRCAMVAALFALHPLHVESVAWISERKDVLSTLFFLLALDAYRRFALAPTAGRRAWLCAWFVLGLLSKPMLVTLPFVLLLLDIWPLQRLRWPLSRPEVWRVVREKLPLFALSIVSSAITFAVQHSAGAVMSSQVLPLGPRALNAIASFGSYLGSTIWPVDLAIYYPYVGGPEAGVVIASGTVLVLVTAWAWKARSRMPSLLVGWSWFLGTLVPVVGIVQVGAQAHADRYMYIPSIGLFLAVVWLVAEITPQSRTARAVLASVCVLILAASAVATAAQVAYWKDTRTLFTRTLAVTTRNAVAHQNLGNALLIDGEIDASIAHLEEALRIIPDFPDAHNNLGSALGNKQRHAEAIEHFKSALRTQETAVSRYNLGFALVQAGRGDEALPEYRRAVELDPDLPRAHAALGAALAARGRLEESASHLSRALALAPDDVETRRSMAITRTLQGRVDEGIREYREVLRRSPDDLDALNNIAWILATHSDAGRRDGIEAVRLAERARDAARVPNHVLFSTLAAAYAESGRFEEAVSAGERAVDLARSARDPAAAARFEIQLELYRRGRPFHQ